MPTRERCQCGAELELGENVAAPGLQLEAWRTGHRHDSKEPEHSLPDPDTVKGTLPQIPVGGVYASTSFGPPRRGIVTARAVSRAVSLDWRTP